MAKLKEHKLPKHHYIPVFYLQQWTNGNGRFIEYRRENGRVVARPTSPKGTGYVRGLYRLPNVPDDKAEIIETVYMRQVDNGAAPALKLMLDPTSRLESLSDQNKVYWARFLHCMVLRSPEYVAAVGKLLQQDAIGTIEQYRAEYPKLRQPNEPETFDEFKIKFLANPLNVSAARIIPQLADSNAIAQHICRMNWKIIEFHKSPHRLLTSDRPIIMTNGIGIRCAHVGIPISPTQLFIAFYDDEGYRKLKALSAKEIIRNANTKVVEQAISCVYGFSDADMSFVSRGFGKRIATTPLETGVLKQVMP